MSQKDYDPPKSRQAHTDAACVLMTLPAVIILPISYVVFKEKVGWQAVAGTMLTIFGGRDPFPCIIHLRFSMRNILKPNLWKIWLTLALLYTSSLLWRSFIVSRISDTFPVGFPFPFYESWGPCQPAENCSESNGWFFIFDIGIWYMVSAFVLHWLRDRKKDS